MKHFALIFLAVPAFLISCSTGKTYPELRLPEIYPDYIGVTFPAQMAPLNFNLRGGYDRVFVKVKGGKGGELTTSGRYANFNVRRWQSLATQNAGDTLTLTVLGRKDGKWFQFVDFKMMVSPYPLTDYGVTYRKFAPGYETYSKIGIYQRNIHNFNEDPIIEGNAIPGQCVGCHTANATDPSRFLFHVRGRHGGTVVQIDGKRKWMNTKTDSTISNAVYSYWHPSGNYVAHSNNHIHQLFWTGRNERYIEVYDDASDVIVHDVRTDEFILSPLLMTDDFETYPAFSCDGKTLFFCRAPYVEVPARCEDVHYDLCSIQFNPEDGSLGDEVTTIIDAVGARKSVTFPRPSYDGRWLMYSYANFGNFPINHKESDLWIMDLASGRTFPATRANSSYDESFHNWSSDSHWFLFASRRDDSLYSQIYFSSIDDEGNTTKAFVLPQRNPEKFYHGTLFTFNVPDFTKEKVKFNATAAYGEAFSNERKKITIK